MGDCWVIIRWWYLASDITHEWEFLEDVEVDDDDLSSLDISLESTEVETVSDGSTLAYSEITLDLESLDNVEDILEGFNVENEWMYTDDCGVDRKS